MIKKSILKLARSLKYKKYRLKENKIILEGNRIILEALKANYPIELILISEKYNLNENLLILSKAKKKTN